MLNLPSVYTSFEIFALVSSAASVLQIAGHYETTFVSTGKFCQDGRCA